MIPKDRHLTRENVIRDTHYGSTVYSNILRTYYPGETLMYIKGDDCGWVKNPWDNSNETLHIWFEKIPNGTRNPDRLARHHDSSGSIPDGSFLDFAEMFYKKSGEDLLQVINQELNLHLGEQPRQGVIFETPFTAEPHFSFFKAPVRTVIPYKQITLRDAYNYIVGSYARTRTLDLRNIRDERQARAFKADRFDYCTFSGTFSARKEDKLLQHSGLLCLDFDHVAKVEELFKSLKTDPKIKTRLLFRSPSGQGLKWIVEIDLAQCSHAQWFRAVANYVYRTYRVPVDQSGKDVCRACFLPWDPNAYLNDE